MDFEKLYDEQFPMVYRYLAVLCGDPSLAEELVQETFYRAIQHSASFRGECKLSVWLCQIGKNCWLTHLRKEKRRCSGAELEPLTDHETVSCRVGRDIGAVYYLVGDYVRLPAMDGAEFEKELEKAVLLWERESAES